MAIKDVQFKYLAAGPGLVQLTALSSLQSGTGSSITDIGRKRMSRRRSLDGEVGLVDNTDFGVSHIKWSEGRLSVTQLMERYRDRLPVLVKATRGYYGRGGLELAVGQILQVCDYCEQLRLRVTDTRTGSRFTLPLDYPVDVHVNDNSNHVQLWKAVESNILPLKVKVANTKVTDSKVSVNSLSSEEKAEGVVRPGMKLRLEGLSNRCFLLTNPLVKGWLHAEEIAVVPDELGPEFKVAQGLPGLTRDEWRDYCAMYARAARHFKLTHIHGYDGVLCQDWSNKCRPPRLPVSTGSVLNVQQYIIPRDHSSTPPSDLNTKSSPDQCELARRQSRGSSTRSRPRGTSEVRTRHRDERVLDLQQVAPTVSSSSVSLRSVNASNEQLIATINSAGRRASKKTPSLVELELNSFQTKSAGSLLTLRREFSSMKSRKESEELLIPRTSTPHETTRSCITFENSSPNDWTHSRRPTKDSTVLVVNGNNSEMSSHRNSNNQSSNHPVNQSINHGDKYLDSGDHQEGILNESASAKLVPSFHSFKENLKVVDEGPVETSSKVRTLPGSHTTFGERPYQCKTTEHQDSSRRKDVRHSSLGQAQMLATVISGRPSSDSTSGSIRASSSSISGYNEKAFREINAETSVDIAADVSMTSPDVAVAAGSERCCRDCRSTGQSGTIWTPGGDAGSEMTDDGYHTKERFADSLSSTESLSRLTAAPFDFTASAFF